MGRLTARAGLAAFAGRFATFLACRFAVFLARRLDFVRDFGRVLALTTRRGRRVVRALFTRRLAAAPAVRVRRSADRLFRLPLALRLAIPEVLSNP